VTGNSFPNSAPSAGPLQLAFFFGDSHLFSQFHPHLPEHCPAAFCSGAPAPPPVAHGKSPFVVDEVRQQLESVPKNLLENSGSATNWPARQCDSWHLVPNWLAVPEFSRGGGAAARHDAGPGAASGRRAARSPGAVLARRGGIHDQADSQQYAAAAAHRGSAGLRRQGAADPGAPRGARAAGERGSGSRSADREPARLRSARPAPRRENAGTATNWPTPRRFLRDVTAIGWLSPDVRHFHRRLRCWRLPT